MKTKTKTKKKKTRTGRRARRGPQGRRLGKWKLVKKKAVLDLMAQEEVSSAELAAALGVGQSAVSAWKSGRRVPSAVAQKKLAALVKRGRIRDEASAASSAASWLSPARISNFRIRWSLSRRALAELLGVSPGTIQNWEAGTCAASSPEEVKRLLLAYKGPVEAPAAAPVKARVTDEEVNRFMNSLAPTQAPFTAELAAAITQITVAHMGANRGMASADVVAFVRELRSALR